jgi:hypothetical protein
MDFDYPVETDDGFTLYEDTGDCPHCDASDSVTPQRMQSAWKKINGQRFFMRGKKCSECGNGVNVLDEAYSDE